VQEKILKKPVSIRKKQQPGAFSYASAADSQLLMLLTNKAFYKNRSSPWSSYNIYFVPRIKHLCPRDMEPPKKEDIACHLLYQ